METILPTTQVLEPSQQLEELAAKIKGREHELSLIQESLGGEYAVRNSGLSEAHKQFELYRDLAKQIYLNAISKATDPELNPQVGNIPADKVADVSIKAAHIFNIEFDKHILIRLQELQTAFSERIEEKEAKIAKLHAEIKQMKSAHIEMLNKQEELVKSENQVLQGLVDEEAQEIILLDEIS